MSMFQLHQEYKKRENLVGPQDEAEVDSYFFDYILDITTNEKRLIRISQGTKNAFILKKFTFADHRLLQLFLFNSSIKMEKLAFKLFLDNLRPLLVKHGYMLNSNYIPLPISKNTNANFDCLYLHHYYDLSYSNSEFLRLGFRLPNDFVLKKYQKGGEKWVLVAEIDLKHKGLHYLYKNQSAVREKADIIENSYEIVV